MVLGTFCKPAYKIDRKIQTLKLIAPKQMKIDMPCKNEKSLNLGAFSDNSVSFSH